MGIKSPAFYDLKGFMTSVQQSAQQWQMFNANNQTVLDKQCMDELSECLTGCIFRIQAKKNQQEKPSSNNPPLPGPANHGSKVPVPKKNDALLRRVPAKCMEARISHRIKSSLQESFVYFARADVDYEKRGDNKWISKLQWIMFIRAFNFAEICGLPEDVVARGEWAPQTEPIDFDYFVELVANLAVYALERAQQRPMSEINIFNEGPKTLAIYRIAEVVGWSDISHSFRIFLRGRQRIQSANPDAQDPYIFRNQQAAVNDKTFHQGGGGGGNAASILPGGDDPSALLS